MQYTQHSVWSTGRTQQILNKYQKYTVIDFSLFQFSLYSHSTTLKEKQKTKKPLIHYVAFV